METGLASLTARLRDDTHSLITGETRPITISLSPNTSGEISDRKSLPAQGLICSNIKNRNRVMKLRLTLLTAATLTASFAAHAAERHHYDHGQLAG
jgi:hypothetical protein